MSLPLRLNPDRLFPAEESIRGVARRLYGEVAGLPIISPHGHTDPAWFATDDAFTDATSLLLAPDHYLYRMLYSQGVPMDSLGVPTRKGASPADPRAAWRLFASHMKLFRGTPSAIWLDHVFAEVFGFDVALDASTAISLRPDRRPERPGLPAPGAVRPLQHRGAGHHGIAHRRARPSQGDPRERLGEDETSKGTRWLPPIVPTR